MATYKIGTRGSLLAVTQSTLIKQELERQSGEKFELVTIKTQGDEVINKPLWQLEGKDFFTKELDEALLREEVDLVIHSYKDLGSERPAGIKLAAVTERKFAHDILLIRKQLISQLEHWSGDFVVGTSSPRRIVNLTKHLATYLPYGKKKNLNIKCDVLRGNINTRIQKLKDEKFHAITLALAGIERLALTESSAAELRRLIEGLDYLVLPQSVFPSAASQGALGIEIKAGRDDEGKLFSLLSKLSHPTTVEEVYRERKAFKEYGGGCHLAVGIHVRKIGEKFLHVHAGEIDGRPVEKRWLEGAELSPITKKKLFVGLPKGEADVVYDEYIKKVPVPQKLELQNKHVFVTSGHCIDTIKQSGVGVGLWAAGNKSAAMLTESGRWINGTSDSLGTEDLHHLRASKALAMFSDISSPWLVLSHADSTSELGEVVGAYTREEAPVSDEWVSQLKEVGACYWTSFPEYKAYIKKFPFLSDAQHFCGLGKTWQEFNRADIKVTPVSSIQDFYSLKGQS